MAKLLLFFFALLLGFTLQLKATTITAPAEMDYCGIRLHFTVKARALLQQEVDKLTRNAAAYAQLAERAELFMPLVEDAFRWIGVPEDLKYIVLQESGLRADAISEHNAVGFWQLKDFTAIEMGLVVNNSVDERRHITRASIGAARYFYKKNLLFNNWVYAVIAYNTGGTGALPFVEGSNYGAREMTIDENLHWYALKAIAHKVAFEPTLSRPHSMWLEPRSNNGILNLKELMLQNHLTLLQFRQYNPWARNLNIAKLPPGRPYTLFVPRTVAYRHIPDPHLDLFPQPPPPLYALKYPPSKVPEALEAAVKTNRTQTADTAPTQAPPQKITESATAPIDDEEFSKLANLSDEPFYNSEFTVLTAGEDLTDFATRYAKPVLKLRKWNELPTGDALQPGQRILLTDPKKIHVHVVLSQDETLASVALLYHRKAEKLASLNGFVSLEEPLKKGQKLYLIDHRPAGEAIIRYRNPYQPPKPPAQKVTPAPPKADTLTPKPIVKVQAPKPAKALAIHVVKKGDTLYNIAQRYGMTVADLRTLNTLPADTLLLGMKLKVMQ